MSFTIPGIVKNGVVVPDAPLPEDARVEIRLKDVSAKESDHDSRMTPAELRKMPREERQAILAAAALSAEEDYHSDKDLTDFEAFREEELRTPPLR